MFSPVRMLLTENTDKSIQYIFIVNNSPNSFTFDIPFLTSSGKELETVGTPADMFYELCPDSTYSVWDDFDTLALVSAEITTAAFSIYCLRNTGNSVDLDNTIITVT